MIAGTVAKRAGSVVRSFSTSAVKNCHHDTTGIVGSTLPFGINNKWLFTLGFTLYVGSGLGLPFLLLRRSMIKNNV